jgi:hypothetical protein
VRVLRPLGDEAEGKGGIRTALGKMMIVHKIPLLPRHWIKSWQGLSMSQCGIFRQENSFPQEKIYSWK